MTMSRAFTWGNHDVKERHWPYTYIVNQWVKRVYSTDHQHHAAAVATGLQDEQSSTAMEFKVLGHPLFSVELMHLDRRIQANAQQDEAVPDRRSRSTCSGSTAIWLLDPQHSAPRPTR